MRELIQVAGGTAGWLAVAALVLLAALHRAHARDLQRLRNWANRSVAGTATSRPLPRALGYLARFRPTVALPAGVGLLLLVVPVVGGLLALRSSGADPDAPTAHANRHRPVPRRATRRHPPEDVTVAVLNATTVPGLAASLREQVAAAGFREGAIGVYPDQGRLDSTVQYASGHRLDAQAVGSIVGVTRQRPLGADGRALAGDASVVVIAGADAAP